MIYVLTGILTVLGAVAGLVLTCYLERRAITSKRRSRSGQDAETGPHNQTT